MFHHVFYSFNNYQYFFLIFLIQSKQIQYWASFFGRFCFTYNSLTNLAFEIRFALKLQAASMLYWQKTSSLSVNMVVELDISMISSHFLLDKSFRTILSIDLFGLAIVRRNSNYTNKKNQNTSSISINKTF